MNSLAVVVGIFLFYRYVQWKHQRIILIVCGIVGLIGAVAIFGPTVIQGLRNTLLRVSFVKAVKMTNVDKYDAFLDTEGVLDRKPSSASNREIPPGYKLDEPKPIYITYRICNRWFSALRQIRFSVSGRHKGRSTNYKLEYESLKMANGNRMDALIEGDSSFHTDTIVGRFQCKELIWAVFTDFDSYHVVSKFGVWHD